MKKNLFIISESEKERILGMHKEATKRSYISEQAAPAAPAATTPAAPATTTPAAPAATTPAAPAATTPEATAPTGETTYSSYSDYDYDYKKEGDKYFFKLKFEPKSPKALAYKNAGKFLSWTEPTGKALEAIKKLPFSSEKLATKPATAVTGQLAADQSKTLAASGGGGSVPKLADPIGDAKKLMPKIDTLDPVKSSEVIAWSKSPSGQYVLNTPADQREAALDNLDRRKGDAKTRELKKEIRQALGMSADTLVGKVASSVRGGVQGLKQGFRQQVTK
jgi:hypothetical protein